MNINVTSSVGIVDSSVNVKHMAVAIGTNVFAYSTDGINWTEGTISSTSRNWYSVCYGNGKFVAVANNTNYFAYSTDGINWTEGTISSTSRLWRSVCYGNGKFVAVANNSNYFAYSTDGITWTEGTISDTSRSWYSVCYGNGKYIVVAYNSNNFAYSTDGINWTEGTISDTSRSWKSVCYGNDKYVAVGEKDYFAYSTDGILWKEGTISSTSRSWVSVCYGNGKFVTVGIANADCIYAYSTDGIHWTEGYVFQDDSVTHVYNIASISYSNGKFIVTAYCEDDNEGTIADNNLSYSTDGINWINSKISNTGRQWYGACSTDRPDTSTMAFNLSHPESASANKFSGKVILDVITHHDSPMYLEINETDTNNSFYIHSPNVGDMELPTDEFDRLTYPVGNNMNKNCIGGKLHPLENGFVAYSIYGNNFGATSKQADTTVGTLELITGVFKANPFLGQYNGYHGVNFYGMENDTDEFMVPYREVNQVKFVSIVNGNKYFAYSTDGIHWTEGTISDTSRNWYSVCYGNGKFVAITYNSNYSAYSEDGIHWVENVISDTSREWLSVCYGNGKFVVIAKATSTYAYSSDGIHWTEGTISDTSRNWYSVCYGNGMFVVVGYTYGLAYSSDGINWTEVSVTSTYWNSVCYGNGKFVAVATSNKNNAMYSTDGITWTDTTLPNSRNWVSVCYGDGMFVTVASDSNYFAYSTDGINWTEAQIGDTSRAWSSICYANGKFIAVATQSIVYVYSTDGITWTEGNMTNGRYWESISGRDSMFVEFSNNHTGISTDGTDINGISTMVTYTEQYSEDIYYIHYAWVDHISSTSSRYNVLTRKIDVSGESPVISNVVFVTTAMSTGDLANPAFYMDGNNVLHCAFYHSNSTYCQYYKLTRSSDTVDSSWSWDTDSDYITINNLNLISNLSNKNIYSRMTQSARRMYLVNNNGNLVEFKKSQTF